MCVAGGKLCFVAKGGLRLVLRSHADIEAALRECHDDPGNGGHRGVTVTLKKTGGHLLLDYDGKRYDILGKLNILSL